VVAVLEPSRRRGALVGVLREEPGGGLLFLLPADPRLPRCFVRPADLQKQGRAWGHVVVHVELLCRSA